MSETQAVEAVNPEPVPEEALSPEDQEQMDYLSEDQPQPEEPQEPDLEKTEPEKEIPSAVDADLHQKVKSALVKSRYEGRQTQRQLREVQETLRQLTQPARERGEEPVIDPDNDPHGAIRYLVAKVQAYENQTAEQQRIQQQQEEQTRIVGQLQTYMNESEQVAQAEFPDYGDAVKHLVTSRGEELKMLGHAEGSINNIIQEEYYGLIYNAMQQGQNPAYLVYNQAKARGYTRGAANPEPAPASTAAQKQLEAMKAGQAAPKPTRGGGAGKTSSSAVTQEMLMNASGQEFDALWAKFEEQNAS